MLLGGGDHSVLDLARHRDERLLHISRILRRGLEEGDPQRVRKLLGARGLHSTLRGEVALVPHKQPVHVLARVTLDLGEPLLHIGEWRHVGDVIHNNDAVGTAVVAAGDGTETLLTGSIPL